MNRSELANLLAQTHSVVASSAVCAESPPCSVRSTSRGPSPSPKQQSRSENQSIEQRKVRKLELDTEVRSRAAKCSNKQRHVSNIPVAPSSAYSTLPSISPQRRHLPLIDEEVQQDNKVSSNHTEEPDFVIEERWAWSRRSPKSFHSISDHGQDILLAPKSPGSPLGKAPILLQPPKRNAERLLQPRKQPKPALRPFEPMQTVADLNDRPKTSHGLRPTLVGQLSGACEHNKGDVPSIKDTSRADRQAKPSKFDEGSMNERSIAVASTWPQPEHASDGGSGSSTDPDTTPRPPRSNTRRESVSDSDGKAVLLTPATAKRGLLRFRSNKAASEADDEGSKGSAKRPKRGLRKSMSNWNFHNLGEKMRNLGGSTAEFTPKAEKHGRDVKATAVIPGPAEVPNERKRKAEEAYAIQFGLKKQKSNGSLAATAFNAPAANTPAAKASIRNRRSLSAVHTSEPTSTLRRRRVSAGPVTEANLPDQSYIDIDNTKRPSRRDLEKENHQLRSLLRQSQSQLFERSVSTHLSQNLAKHGDENDIFVRTSSDKGVPPVPKLVPSAPKQERQPLASVGIRNGQVALKSGTRQQPTPPTHIRAAPQTGSLKGRGRPVSVIREEDETSESIGEEGGSDGYGTSAGPEKQRGEGHGEGWKGWPDDLEVF